MAGVVLAVLGLLLTTGGITSLAPQPTGPSGRDSGSVATVVIGEHSPPARSSLPVTTGARAVRPASSPSHVSVQLPYGISLAGAYEAFASSIPGVTFGPSTASCSGPSANMTPGEPVVLSASSELVCLNGARSGLVSSAWSGNLSNFTSYRNGTTTVVGCPPIPPFTKQAGCAFYASSEYTGYVPIWVHDAPVNSSETWEPDLTGLSPSDLVFDVELGANSSTPTDTLYALTLKVSGPMPAPLTFYVRTPAQAWSGERNLTLLLDLDLAWMSMLNNSSSPMVYPTVGGYSLSMNYVPPCSDCFVNFVESGLGPGSAWSVTMNGSTGSSTRTATGSSLAFRERNGSYSFAVVTAAGCSGEPSTGSLTVGGSDQAVPVNFSALSCPVTFAETGLPQGNNWSVVVGGLTHYSTTTSIVVNEPNGTYPFVVSNVTGYTVTPSQGRIVVKGAAVTRSVTFSLSSKAATFLGLPIAEGYALIGAIVAVVLVGGIAAWLLARRGPHRGPGKTELGPTDGAPPGTLERPGRP